MAVLIEIGQLEATSVEYILATRIVPGLRVAAAFEPLQAADYVADDERRPRGDERMDRCSGSWRRTDKSWGKSSWPQTEAKDVDSSACGTRPLHRALNQPASLPPAEHGDSIAGGDLL
jgi:hypothetical protein